MRRWMTLLVLAAACTGLTAVHADAPAPAAAPAPAPAPEPATGPGGMFYVRGTAGFAQHVLGSLNAAIAANERFFHDQGAPFTWDRFDGAPSYGGEVGMRIRRGLSLGVGVDVEKSHLANQLVVVGGAIRDQMDLSLVEWSANAALWPAPLPGLYLGGRLGVGYGHFDETQTLRIDAEPQFDFDAVGSYKGHHLTGGLFAGYEIATRGRVGAFGEAGYRWRQLHNFDGTRTVAPAGTTDRGDYIDPYGNVVRFDLSGTYVRFGVSAAFGGER